MFQAATSAKDLRKMCVEIHKSRPRTQSCVVHRMTIFVHQFIQWRKSPMRKTRRNQRHCRTPVRMHDAPEPHGFGVRHGRLA